MSVSLLVFNAMLQVIEAGYKICAFDGSSYIQKTAWGYTYQSRWKSTRIFDNASDALNNFLFAEYDVPPGGGYS